MSMKLGSSLASCERGIKNLVGVIIAGFVKVAKTDEVAPVRIKLVEVNGKKIALFNVELFLCYR
jgi:hypothetical protein